MVTETAKTGAGLTKVPRTPRRKRVMKRVDLVSKVLSADVINGFSFVWLQWRKQQLPLAIFIVMCLNLVIAPVVYAAAGGALERRSAWAIGILGFVVLALVVYLFVVVFQPERF
jgi:K+-transporting ATPase KdpF subunit